MPSTCGLAEMATRHSYESLPESLCDNGEREKILRENSEHSLDYQYIQPGCYVAPKAKPFKDASLFLQKFPMQWCPWSPATYIVDISGRTYYLTDIINGNFGYELQFQVNRGTFERDSSSSGDELDYKSNFLQENLFLTEEEKSENFQEFYKK